MHEDFTGLYLSSVWLSLAMLSGSHARSRNRSAWTWSLLTLFLGPLAVLLLVTWPARPAQSPRAPSTAESNPGQAR